MTARDRVVLPDGELRPEYIEKAKAILRECPIDVGTTEDLKKLIGN